MARVPLIEKDGAPAEVVELYDDIARWLQPEPGPRAALAPQRVPQIWRALANAPPLARRVFEGSSYVLSSLPWAKEHYRLRQLIILAVTRRLGCEFAFTGHWPHCERAGMSRSMYERFMSIEGLEAAKTSADFSDEERLLIRFADDLVRTGHPAPADFAELVRRYGDRGAVEIAGIVAFRMMTSALINALDVHDD